MEDNGESCPFNKQCYIVELLFSAYVHVSALNYIFNVNNMVLMEISVAFVADALKLLSALYILVILLPQMLN